MSAIDDVINAFLDLVEFFDLDIDDLIDEISEASEPTEVLALLVETFSVVDENAALFVDTIEELALLPIQQAGELDPDGIEGVVDEAEGNAFQIIAGTIILALAIEIYSVGQVDKSTTALVQAVAGLNVDDVTGRELDARLQEGVDPALKQKVHREHRSKQADFIDYVDANRTAKSFDGTIPTRSGEIPEGMRDLLHPDDFGYLADPDTYGTIPDQTPLYELSGLQVGEPEEIIEEPIQYGLPVPLRPVEAVNAVSGAPEDVKAIYRQVINELPKTENLIQDYVRLTEFNFRLREKVQAGAITADQAANLIEPELRDLIVNALPDDRYREEDRTADEVVDILIGELQRNFKLLSDLPKDPPTFSDFERAFRQGILSAERFQEINNEYGVPGRFFGMKLQENIIRQGTEDIVRQEALGRLSTRQAAFRLSFIGWTDGQAARLLSGADPDNIIRGELTGQRSADELDVTLAPEIGEARGAVLSQVGVETLSDLAESDVDTLTSVTNLSNDQASRVIQASVRILEDAG
jgi:hypothetical protein